MISSVDTADLLTEEASSTKDKTYISAFFITAPVFIGYACCFSLQHRLGNVFGLADGAAGNSRSYYYGIGTSFVYFFNLIFRVIGHNLLFGCFSPRVRVIIALASMIVGQTMLSVVAMAKSPPHLAWVFISYAFCGVCEGSYCPNMFNVVNNLGKTRQQVVTAIPFGVSLITILGFALFSFGMPFQLCYMFTSVCTFGAIILYLIKIYPVANTSASTFSFKDFFNDFKNIKEWFPKIWGHCLVFIINMFCLSLFNPGCTLYAFNERVHYKLLGFTLPHDAFILTCNIGNFLGDLLSRIVMDRKRIINPMFFFILLIFGIITNLALIPEITPLASFVFGWANGGLYTQTTKLIGLLFVDKYHLTAMSTWLFVGDIGSTSGSNCVQPMRPVLVGIKQIEY
ncbi:hypothetical protein TVAG_457010 [Trichomonas vaginalis G3]|uniref:Major Facilitator Superfamily protein n=1 Tax=Trichomonas vaginalis (strain ATCC PRA-98 / G3) TaxID=412133 RepID=A2DC25_TRIV3|nr:Major Facilitator Superfamily (MFS) general substrate transporter family [Trichomonas vaginalis G3]EAY22066.1 hypothetical protein TVAG_457010 [Trichomonas vaginalis G3]KAI5525305.1 Major Facilitator Superfamily (MFS) general substrate transporter family [Trichomonas vaginalis G3]|eukprot:XP_001583052.1 hypothetical protein [Trichomonas vaginalis G3]